MGLRFRKSVRLGKGARINLGKRGASLSLGGKGGTVNLSGRGIRSTAGIPGTGISYSASSGKGRRRKSSGAGGGLLWLLIIAAPVHMRESLEHAYRNELAEIEG